jgi:hypothetical protein
MKMHDYALALAVFALGAQPASALSFNLSGQFAHDNDVALAWFTLGAAGSVTLNTTSFAAGGFVPFLSLFDGAGNFVTSSPAPSACGGGNPAPADPVSSACWDAYISNLSLGAGTYTLALTEFDNTPAGSTLADGFAYSGGPADFTGGPFLDALAGQRTGNWALGLQGVTSAGTVPEPAPLALALAGCLAYGAASRRRREHQG